MLHKSTVSMYKYLNNYIQMQLPKATKLCLSLNDDCNGTGASNAIDGTECETQAKVTESLNYS